MSNKQAKADAAVAKKREDQQWQLAQEARKVSSDKANYLDSSRGERLKGIYSLRDQSSSFLAGDAAGKDVSGLMSGDLSRLQSASGSAKQANRMAMDTGSRALGGVDPNFMAQLDTMKNLDMEQNYAHEAANLYGRNKGEAKTDLSNTTNMINNDEFNTANVLNGNASQGLQFVGAAESSRAAADQRNQSVFSKYVMPFVQSFAGVAASPTGGAVASRLLKGKAKGNSSLS